MVGNSLRGAFRSLAILLLAFTFEARDFSSAQAGQCGAYCKARMVRALCHNAVTAKGLDAHQRDLEFERCKVDPRIHQQIEELADDDMDGLE